MDSEGHATAHEELREAQDGEGAGVDDVGLVECRPAGEGEDVEAGDL